MMTPYRSTTWADYKVIPYEDYNHDVEEYVPLPNGTPENATDMITALQRLLISPVRPPGFLRFECPDNLKGTDDALPLQAFDRVVVVYNVTRLGHNLVMFEGGTPPSVSKYRLFVILDGFRQEHAQDLIGLQFFNGELGFPAAQFAKGDIRHQPYYNEAIECLQKIHGYEVDKVRKMEEAETRDGEKSENGGEAKASDATTKLSRAKRLWRQSTMYLRAKAVQNGETHDDNKGENGDDGYDDTVKPSRARLLWRRSTMYLKGKVESMENLKKN
jgi:hypothetical protein